MNQNIQQKYDFEETKLMLTTILSELSFLGEKINNYAEDTIKGATYVRQFTKELSSVYPHLRRVADVQQDIYANTIAVWSTEQKELEEQISIWKSDVSEAMEMLNILEILEKYLPENGGNSEEYLNMRTDVEKRMQNIEAMRVKNTENILSKFLAIQNQYFSSALRLSNGLIGKNAQEVGGLEEASLKQAMQSWKDAMPPLRSVDPEIPEEINRSDSERTISSIISSHSVDNNINRGVEFEKHKIRNQSPSKEKIVDQSEMFNFLNGFNEPKDVNIKKNKDEPFLKIVEEDMEDVLVQHENHENQEQNGDDDRNVDSIFVPQPEKERKKKFENIVSLQLNTKNQTFKRGEHLTGCIFELNTHVVGDVLYIDICNTENLTFISKGPIVVAPQNSSSTAFDIRIGEAAKVGPCKVNILLSGSNVQNLKIFEVSLDFIIADKVEKQKAKPHVPSANDKFLPFFDSELPKKEKPIIIQNVPKSADNIVDPFPDLLPVIPSQNKKQIKKKPVSSNQDDIDDIFGFFTSKKEEPAVQPKQESKNVDNFLDFIEPKRRPRPQRVVKQPFPGVNYALPQQKMNVPMGRFSRPSDIHAPGYNHRKPKAQSMNEKKPVNKQNEVPDLLVIKKKDPLQKKEPWDKDDNTKKVFTKFDTKCIASHGEGFRERDIDEMFLQFALPNSEVVDSFGFQQVWENLCIRGNWQEAFISISDDAGLASKVPVHKLLDQTMRKEAEDDVEQEVDVWEFSVKPERKKMITLMSSMKNVLTYDTGDWKPPQLSDLLNRRKVRQIYRKTLRIVHPDRTKSLIYRDRARAERVYRALTDEFEKYKDEN